MAKKAEKLSEQIEALQAQLNKFPDEVCNEGIQDSMQSAWAHLDDVRGELAEAGL
jgi:hypothetical protein